ncbi:uncharacterized protein [Typha angustifolia]|uniref:uncharacterized protein n=1 Tax=Typha angustifolia TaxID=59011 RepID=UPI003C2E1B27
MSDPNANPRLGGLLKQRSWSPDSERDETWIRRKGLHRDRRGIRIRSVTDEDIDELRGCMDLGFAFDSDCCGKRLAETFPALDLYYAVHRSYPAAGTSPLDSASSSSVGSPAGSPISIFSPGDNPEAMKARLKQWAQVVAWSVRHGC